MRKSIGALCLGVFMAALAFAPPLSAGPEPQKLKAAAESFEAGARAFKDGKFEEAAAHFEAADAAVPGPKALRLAIRARDEAGQDARAATLAALALERYSDDPETKKAAEEEIAKVGKSLHRLQISCASPCLLAASAHIVHGEPTTRWVVYLFPGKATIGASIGRMAVPEQTVTAVAGGASSIRFGPTEGPRTGAVGAGGSAGTAGTPSDGGAALDSGGGATEDTGPPSGVDDDWRISPGFFVAGLVVTAGMGATTIWSGVDTVGDPGADQVRAACAGQGESCPAYQDGQAKEVRTNALIGATAGAAALTLVFALVADWDGSPDPETPASVAVEAPRLWVGWGNASPTGASGHGASTTGGAAGVEVRGHF